MDSRFPEPLMCSQGGIPYNKAHLDAKDAEILRLNKLLEGRDRFIVNNGLWQAFVDQLPKRSGS